MGGIFCDQRKAFVCVQHKILLDKLKFYGIDGKFGTLIESYLTNRYQNVSPEIADENKNFSDWAKINCGVPQGSILGPLFFLIYINDLPTIVNGDNNIVFYADDASIVLTDSNRAELNLNVNGVIKIIINWFKNNLINLNFTKTQYLEFRCPKHHTVNTQIHHYNEYISNVTQSNILGLTLDDTLTWKQHIDLLIKKISSMSYALIQVKYTFPIEK